MSEDCPHCVFEKTESNCRGCFEGSHYKPKPVTNADRVRNMDVYDLAIFLENVSCKHADTESWLDWLRQEVES